MSLGANKEMAFNDLWTYPDIGRGNAAGKMPAATRILQTGMTTSLATTATVMRGNQGRGRRCEAGRRASEEAGRRGGARAGAKASRQAGERTAGENRINSPE